jgi:hypothetical protein
MLSEHITPNKNNKIGITPPLGHTISIPKHTKQLVVEPCLFALFLLFFFGLTCIFSSSCSYFLLLLVERLEGGRHLGA